MKHLSILSLAVLSGIVCGDGFKARRIGAEINVEASHVDDTQRRDIQLEKRIFCGNGFGSCPTGQCCSASGNCGTSKVYCAGPQCQIAYSNGNCDASKKPGGESTANVSRDRSGKVPYNVYITNCSEPGTLALTFDDGPYNYTDHVLDVLKEHEVKATFFIVGNNLGKGHIDDESTGWPKVLRRMHAAGHQLASHSWTHQNLSTATEEVRRQQIIYNEMAFRNIFGWFPKYMRPPYGTCSRVSGCLDYLTNLGYHVINYNIETQDHIHDSASEIQISKNIFSNSVSPDAKVHNYIALSHDTHQQTAYNLTTFMLKTLKDRGYRAVTVGDCLGDPPNNWYVNASMANPGG